VQTPINDNSPKQDDYFLGSERLHWGTVAIISIIAAFLRWFRLDNCVLASGDEWLAVGPTFQFLEKFFRNPITAIGFELAAGFPFLDIGRMGPPFDYTRSVVLIWSMPYYAIVSLFDFPVSEAWYRFPGTIWSLMALGATYFFVYQLTRRHISALFALALQATLIGHLVQSRFLVADGVFLFWFALAAGLWIKYLREDNPRIRHLAYIASMLYASSTPEAYIGLVSIVSLIIFYLWQEGKLDPFKPLAALKLLCHTFIALPILWLVGFYGFQVMVELKFYIHDPDNFLNHANYLGRFWGRGSGELGFFPDRVVEWYIYPHISLPLILASLASILLIPHRRWRALLAYGWLWATFWVLLTLVVSNSSSNFTRVMPAFLVLGAAGLTALYDQQRQGGSVFAAGMVALNIYFVFSYPMLCAMPEDENVAQAVGYVIYENERTWQDAEAEGIAFYFPTGSLQAYMPESVTMPYFITDPDDLCPTEPVAESIENVDIIFTLPAGYPIAEQMNHILIYAVDFECEVERIGNIEQLVQDQGYSPIGQIINDDGFVHANIWSRIEIPDIGIVNIHDANQLHHELYSRWGWFQP